MVKLRTQAQRKGMLNAQNYAQISGSNLMLKFKVSTMGLSSEIKVETKRKIPMIKLFTTLQRAQLNTTLNSLAKFWQPFEYLFAFIITAGMELG